MKARFSCLFLKVWLIERFQRKGKGKPVGELDEG
jgi:hypothetical protein